MPKKMPNFLSVLRSKIPRHFTQVMATLAVSLGPFSAGLGKGYSSPALASLQVSKTSSFHVSAQEGSWVASLSLLGALFGCLVGGLMLQVGRKRSLLIVALPFSGSWLLTVFAQRVEMMYSTSFIGGFFSAVTLLASQVYVSEIAHPEIRGCLSAVLKMAGEIGTLSSFTLGAFLDWRQLAMVGTGGPILFFFAILLVPETPSFLLYHGREEEASRAMSWLRSSKDDVASEIETLRSNILTKYKSFFPRCSSSQFPFRQLFITCGLMFFQKFSGVTVFHHYAVPIFKQVFGRSIDAHGAAIVVVLLRIVGSMTSGLLIDTAGRLPLLIVSNLFISASFFGFGLYNWMEESLPASYPGFGPSLDWIPLTCVLFFTLFFSIGIGPISWLMVGELFPLEYRGFGAAVSTSFSYACAFAAVKTYVDIKSYVGLYGAFWIYSAISMAGLVFVCCVVPETKGVELEEMHHEGTITTLPPPHGISAETYNTFFQQGEYQKINPEYSTSSTCPLRETPITSCQNNFKTVLASTASAEQSQLNNCGRIHLPLSYSPPPRRLGLVDKSSPKKSLNLTTTKHPSNYTQSCQVPISKMRSKSCQEQYPAAAAAAEVPIQEEYELPNNNYCQYKVFYDILPPPPSTSCPFSRNALHRRTMEHVSTNHHHYHLQPRPLSTSFYIKQQFPEEEDVRHQNLTYIQPPIMMNNELRTLRHNNGTPYFNEGLGDLTYHHHHPHNNSLMLQSYNNPNDHHHHIAGQYHRHIKGTIV